MITWKTSLMIVTIGMLLYWYMDTPLPEDMKEKWKVKVIDAAMRTYGHVAQILCAMGVMEPFSSLDRKLADMFVMTMSTGRPWSMGDDPALKITDMHTDKTKIHLRMYEPVTKMHEQKRPVLFYFHGGGFSVLSVESYDVLTRRIAKQSGIVVISVDYRLSPQNPYPGPDEDCIEAIDYISAMAESMRIDISRVAIGGDSAGGNLAASLSFRLRNRIKIQLLLVPFLQIFSFNTTSIVENGQYFSKSSNNIYQLAFAANYFGCCWDYINDIINSNHTSVQLKNSKYASYVDQEKWMDKSCMNSDLRKKDISQRKDIGRNDMPEEFEKKMTDPYVLPLMAGDDMLHDLPRAYVMTAGYDFIRDDGVMYAQRLKHAGIPVHHVNHRTSFHCALLFLEGPLKLDVAKQTVQDITDYLQIHLLTNNNA